MASCQALEGLRGSKSTLTMPVLMTGAPLKLQTCPGKLLTGLMTGHAACQADGHPGHWCCAVAALDMYSTAWPLWQQYAFRSCSVG